MRGYIAITPEELTELVANGQIEIDSAFIPTVKFKAANPDLGEEESEYILSLLATDDSNSFQGDSAKFTFALALDLEKSQLGEEVEFEVKLISPVKFAQVDCLFVGDVSSEADELTWYAAQEISAQLPFWQAI